MICWIIYSQFIIQQIHLLSHLKSFTILLLTSKTYDKYLFTMTKKEKAEKCKTILNKYAINDTLTDIKEKKFLISVFENHKEWTKKKGKGVKSISIVANIFNRCFQLNRVDGTSTDISYDASINPPTKTATIKKACRDAIRNLIVEYRDANVIYGKSTCDISNTILTKENTHIDHYDLTFNDMFKLWLEKHDLDSLYNQVNETKDNDVVTCFNNENIKLDFINFHNNNSKLRAVTKKSNLSTLRKLK